MIDDEPYPLHNGRELELMLAGDKPLAVFLHKRDVGLSKEDVLGGQDFATFVANGTLKESRLSLPLRSPEGASYVLDYWLYTLPDQEWRVEAYRLIIEILHRKRAWCSHLEWLEGTLLGYTEEQNRYHLGRQYSQGSKKDQCD